MFLSLTFEAEQEGLAARIKYPQNLESPAEYDLWEIKRDASLPEIFEEIRIHKTDIDRDRVMIQAGKRKVGERAIAPRWTLTRILQATEIYKQRTEGIRWNHIAQRMGRNIKTPQKILRDFCEELEFERPKKGSVIRGGDKLGQCLGDECPNRRGPADPCPECPALEFLGNLRAAETKQSHLITKSGAIPDRPDDED
jgi:hypothetical protein